MEGTPFIVESNAEDPEERRRKEAAEKKEERKAKKPEAFGILAVEAPSEKPDLSPLEKAIAESKRSIDENKDDEPAPEAEMPVERVPIEQAHEIVRNMVAAKEREDEPDRQAEPAPEAASEVEVESIETPEVEVPVGEEEPEPEIEIEAEAEAESEPTAPTETVEDAPDEIKIEHVPAVESVTEEERRPEVAEESQPEAEAESEPETVAEKPKVKAEPKPKAEVAPEVPEEKPEIPDEDDDSKPGIINSLLGRRGRNKVEEELSKGTQEVGQHEATPEEPEFQFNEEAREEPVEEPESEPVLKPELETVSEKPKTEELPKHEAAEPETEEEDPKPAPERIGHMIVTTEAAPAERRPQPVAEATASSLAAEEKMKVETSPVEPASGKRIDTMNRAELMELGEKIDIDGNNLRHIYETHLIGERGLRRLIIEHLRGGDLRKALRREVMEREMDFERDPVMRDLPLSASAAATHDTGTPALEKLLKNADVSLADTGEKTAFFKAQAKYENTSAKRNHQQRRLIDISLVVVIACLVGMAVFIYLRHG